MNYPKIWIKTGKYQKTDTTENLQFYGKYIIYNNDTIKLDRKHFFIDGSLPSKIAKNIPYVYTSVKEAAKYLTDGTEQSPMNIYIAPYVYWIDNPNDTSVKKPEKGSIPYGLIIKTNWLSLHGLTKNPENVVLASSRGHTQGAVGNFTMLRFDGNGISAENITFGNYCNVDLIYPLKPELGRKKRNSTITQAQLVICQNSDKVFLRNCSFISRLNSCPFVGTKRALFYGCHFECTDDALNGRGVYENCDFDLYSSKPIYHSDGAVFLNCNFNIIGHSTQHISKTNGQASLIDCRFHSRKEKNLISWVPYPDDNLRCYQSNVTLNGKKILLQQDKPNVTVNINGTPAEEAYRIILNGDTIYNTYNLLSGSDGWDPLHNKEKIKKASESLNKELTKIPESLIIKQNLKQIETGKDTIILSCYTTGLCKKDSAEDIKWNVITNNNKDVEITKKQINSCIITGKNYKEAPKKVIIEASTEAGLKAAASITVLPLFLKAPEFSKKPHITKDAGQLKLNYSLNTGGRIDQSHISWYRCTNDKGNNPVKTSVSRMNSPERNYKLTKGDIGYYIKAVISPKHNRSHTGKDISVITNKPVTKDDIITKNFIETYFKNFPGDNQKNILPGFWTVDTYKPEDTKEYKWTIDNNENAWFYGSAKGGCRGYGFLQKHKGARILYTPVKGAYQDMEVLLKVDPCKTAGQGFGSATAQYMDIYIKFDTKTLSGYALRIIRTTKHANAVDFILIKYKNGITKAITEPVSATCFRTGCSINLKVTDNILNAHVKTTTPKPSGKTDGLPHVVNLKTKIENNNFGGSGIQHTGSAGASSTMLHYMKIIWNN